jgi:hypothetical protein
MPDITLILKADTDQYIKEINKALKATQSVSDSVNAANKKQKGIIQEEIINLQKLRKWRLETNDPSMIKKYNQAIEESINKLNEYNTVGVEGAKKLEKSGSSLMRSVKGWAAGFVTVSAAVGVFKKIIESTDNLSTKFQRTLNGWKEGFSAMARAIANNDFENFFKNIREAVKEGQRYTDTQEKIEDTERAIKIRIAERETALINLRVIQQDATKTEKERLDAGIAAEKILADNAQDRLTLAEIQLDNDITNAAFAAKTSKEIVKAYLDQDEALLKNIETGKKYKQLQTDLAGTVQIINTGTSTAVIVDKEAEKIIKAKINALGSEAKEYEKLAVGLESVLDPLKDKITADYEQIESAKQSAINLRVMTRVNSEEAKAQKKIDTETKKSKEDFYNKLEQLQEQYDKKVVESLTGEDKLEAIRDYELKQIDILRNELVSLGELTPEMKKQLDFLAQQVNEAFTESLYKLRSSPEKEMKTTVALLKGLPTISELAKSYIKTSDEDQFKFSLADKLGLDEEGIQDIKEALGSAFGDISDALQGYYDKEFENAEKHRELLDQRVSETQQALDDEIALYEAGYASNVAAKQKELVALQKARDEALKEEEKALKRQLILESALQAASLASAVAVLFKKGAEKLGLGGIIAAGINIAAMFAAFAASVAKIRSATAAYKLEEGGSGTDYGIVTGKRHSQGGENFLDHVEVEKGESWGVLSRPASEKYGKVFHEMVSSFNKNEMPSFMPVTNQVRVENSGPNTRLDRVNTSINKLNDNLTKQSHISHIGNKKIIKSGNKIRIVG